MKKKLFCLTMLWCLFVNGQQEASNWYFGDKAGISFDLDANTVISETDGQLETREGCASISDSNGGLLFYTDGTTVYSSEHQVMEGGEGLLGDASSTQSALIVPKPNDPEIYYIFTVGSNLNPTGLNYSIVDTRQNGELGEVVTKNVPLLINCAEKISAVVKDCTTGSIWVITLSNSNGRSVNELNTFHAFEVSEDGVDDNAVTSNFDFNLSDTRGYLKFSPDGTKLGCANVQSGLYLFDFDSQTGLVSNESINNLNYRNIANPEIIHVRVTNDLTGCYSFAELTLNVSLTDSNDAELIVCDDDGIEDGFNYFTLNNSDNDIINGLPIGLNISYYETYEDALLETNVLDSTYRNKIAYSDIIFARVENENNCYGISQLLLTVNKLPNIDSDFLTFYCLNNFPQPITLNAGIINDSSTNYSYEWSTGEVSYEINTNHTGSYSVIVTNSNGCNKEKVITVEASNIATIESVQVVDASQNNIITILVSGEGIYDYALLNENGVYINYQTSNTFENIMPGIYTVSIRDIKNDCGLTQDLVSVIGFPKYFTPNNDGIHDTWQVYGLSSQFQPNSLIYIYDRYGKLLKQLNPLDKGWNGIFNGEILPNDDYWFSVKLQDGRIFKNHFTLKR